MCALLRYGIKHLLRRRNFVLHGQFDINTPHLRTPRILWAELRPSSSSSSSRFLRFSFMLCPELAAVVEEDVDAFLEAEASFDSLRRSCCSSADKVEWRG